MNFSRTINIQKTPEKIWDSLVQFEKICKWNSCVLETKKISTGKMREWFQSRSLIKEGKKSVWYEEEILIFTPYTRLKIKLSGDGLGKDPMFLEYELNETSGKTEVIQTIEWKPSGFFFKLFHGIIEKMSIKDTEKVLHSLKIYLEEWKIS